MEASLEELLYATLREYLLPETRRGTPYTPIFRPALLPKEGPYENISLEEYTKYATERLEVYARVGDDPEYNEFTRHVPILRKGELSIRPPRDQTFLSKSFPTSSWRLTYENDLKTERLITYAIIAFCIRTGGLPNTTQDP